MAEKELINEKQDSIDLSRTAKGLYSWKVKLYYDSSKESPTTVITKIKDIDEKMLKSFGGGK